MNDKVTIALAYNDEVRIYATNSTNLVKTATKIHKTLPTASAAFGRFLTVGVIMSLMHKNGEKLSLRIVGDGPIKYLTCETHSGLIKGDIANPDVYSIYEDGPKKGKLNVADAIGNGTLYVTKDFGLKEPFTSSVALVSSEIAEDFTYYFATSEQTPSAVSLGVAVKNNKIISSGGFILQLLPNCSEETIVKIEKVLASIPSISQLFSEGKTQYDIINILANNNAKILEELPIKYYCGCRKTKFTKSLGLLPIEELKDMISEDQGCHIACNFCKKEYNFSQDELTTILNKKLKNRTA